MKLKQIVLLGWLVLLTGVFFFVSQTTVFAATVSSVQSGNWSDAATWGPAGADGTQNNDIIITSGHHVVLDLSPLTLRSLTIQDGASLTFAHQDINLTTDYILNMGIVEIGTESQPFPNKAIITFTAHDKNEQVMGSMGTKGFLSRGPAKTDLHGQPVTPTWTRLGATVTQGSSQITLTEPTNWKVGDRLVIASTDYDQ